MRWLDFLQSILEENQIEILRKCLKTNTPVYFYGEGTGKSTLVNVLRFIKYESGEPGDFSNGHSRYVPDSTNCVSFNVKNKTPNKIVPKLNEILRGQKKEIVEWINLCI